MNDKEKTRAKLPVCGVFLAIACKSLKRLIIKDCGFQIDTPKLKFISHITQFDVAYELLPTVGADYENDARRSSKDFMTIRMCQL